MTKYVAVTSPVRYVSQGEEIEYMNRPRGSSVDNKQTEQTTDYNTHDTRDNSNNNSFEPADYNNGQAQRTVWKKGVFARYINYCI
jgi:hypothetical protein